MKNIQKRKEERRRKQEMVKQEWKKKREMDRKEWEIINGKKAIY